MTDSTPFDGAVSATDDAVGSLDDPEAAAAQRGIEVDALSVEHGGDEAWENHPEHGTAGRAVVGATDNDGRLLAGVADDGAAYPLTDTVPPEGDFAAAGRAFVAGATGSDATLTEVRAVRAVEHTVDGAVRVRTHHVVFGARVADDTVRDGLCETNPLTLRWLDAVPAATPAGSVRDDLALFVGAE
ncbi:hypothetical protein [Halosegnis marinus]|uniref:Uncharacterized protein n=1 Tax=Halosegnis marinus TaxID=3034023 RepID=A0ABD5ZNV7_9EURY|nr:hypothetical protein [Halosegnis sp. DT85]